MGLMYQCRMRRGNAETVGWIAERGAKVGASVELLTGDGEFWTVTEVYDFPQDEARVYEKQALNRGSLPSLMGR